MLLPQTAEEKEREARFEEWEAKYFPNTHVERTLVRYRTHARRLNEEFYSTHRAQGRLLDEMCDAIEAALHSDRQDAALLLGGS